MRRRLDVSVSDSGYDNIFVDNINIEKAPIIEILSAFFWNIGGGEGEEEEEEGGEERVRVREGMKRAKTRERRGGRDRVDKKCQVREGGP